MTARAANANECHALAYARSARPPTPVGRTADDAIQAMREAGELVEGKGRPDKCPAGGHLLTLSDLIAKRPRQHAPQPLDAKIDGEADYVVWRDGVVVPSQKAGSTGRKGGNRISVL